MTLGVAIGSDGVAMWLCQIKRILKAHRSIVVSFSGTPRGVGAGQSIPDFPDDLAEIVQKRGTWEIACSTVAAGHTRGGGNLMGSVGLVVRMRRGRSLRGVCSGDGGSSYDPVTGIRKLGACVLPTPGNCEGSIVARSGHNEWIVGDYDVVGIFFDGTMEVWDSVSGFNRQASIPDIRRALGDLPLVYFYEGELWEVDPERRIRRLEDFI